jgi:DNA-binding helix-hairpin-helix protein with protein kinase domain
MSKQPPEVVDGRGQRLRLGPLLGRGGEGSVFELSASPDLVAKIYHSALSAERVDKIRTMIALRNDRIGRLTAWPVDLLSMASSRAPIGLLMPKITGRKDIHHLYSPKSRRVDFQRADWRFLIRASANTARAFAVVHETGCIIGDVNHGGVLVAQDATVRLIDCDSFQVMNARRRFLCEVGVETFTPPELQGKSFKGVIRHQNHDNFGLAVLIFLLLFMGRHPFAGRYLGPDQMPIPRAIKECRFAYGARRAIAQMEQPPGTPALSIVGDDVAFLFERAFAKEMIAGGRPTPRDWVDGLERLEKVLKQCSANPSHWHRNDTSCPWCPMEGATGVPLFPVIADIATTAVDVDALWRQVEAIPHPGQPPAFGTPAVQASQAAKSAGSANQNRKIIASLVAGIMIAIAALAGLPKPLPFVLFVGGVAAFFALLRLLDKTEVVRSFEVAKNTSSARWTEIQRLWQERTGPRRFEQKKSELQAVRRLLGEIPDLRLEKLDKLRQNQRAVQLATFLDQYEIQRAKITGIGPARKQTLQSYGIETAADLNSAAITVVPGFGEKMADKLLAWRRSLERKFRFDPAKAIDPRDTMRVEQEVLVERRRLEERLRTGFAELKQTHGQILAARQHMMPQVTAAHAAYLQAEADFKAARGP